MLKEILKDNLVKDCYKGNAFYINLNKNYYEQRRIFQSMG